MHSRNLFVRPPIAPVNSDVTTWALSDGATTRLGRGKVEDFAISADGTLLATGTRLGLWWYNLSSLEPIAVWETERGLISAVAFSPNGKWLGTGNWDGTVKVWDVHRGHCVAQMERQEKPSVISQLAFSPDGQYLAASGVQDDIIYVWHLEKGEQVVKFSGNAIWRNCRPARPLAFSPDGCLLACASPDNTLSAADFISVWSVKTGERIAAFRGHTTLVYALSFSPCGGRLASGDRDGMLREWDVIRKEQARKSSEYSKYQVIPSYSPSGCLFAAGVDENALTVWDVERAKILKKLEHNGNISIIRFSNGTHIAVASAPELKVWTIDTPNKIVSISGHPHIPFSLMFSPDGRILTSIGEGSVMFWDVASKTLQTTFAPNTHIRSCVYSSGGDILAAGFRNTTVEVWAIGKQQDERIAKFTSHQKQVRATAFSQRGNYLATGDATGKLDVWDIQRKEKLSTLLGHSDAILSVRFAPDEKWLASVAYNRNVRLWDIERGEEITSLPLTPLLDAEKYRGTPLEIQRTLNMFHSLSSEMPPRPPLVKTIEFSPCGTLLAGGLWREIRLWDTTTYDIHMAILQPRGCQFPFALAFSPCGSYLASGAWWQGTDKVSIRLWNVANGENIATFWGHSTDIQSLAFSPDQALLASGSFDGTIQIWDMKPYL